MKRKYFNGVAVFSGKIDPKKPTLVGVWFRRPLSAESRRLIKKDLNARLKNGCIGVRSSSGRNVVYFLGRLRDVVEARKTASFLSKVVFGETGARSILRQLRNVDLVRRALA